jgi:hypothetical protein
MSREGEARRPALLEPPKRSPRSSLLPTATASPPVRADVSKSTASQGRARWVGLQSGGALVLALTAVLRLGSRTEAATSKGSQRT